MSYILSHPDAVPQWLNFEVSRFGAPQEGTSICDNAGLRHKRDVGGMMDRLPIMNASMMHGPMMNGHGPMMHGHGPMMPDGPMNHGPMMHGEVGHHGDKGADDGKTLPKLNELMLPGQVLPNVADKMPEAHDSVGVQLADVLSNPDNKVSAKHEDADDDRNLIIMPIGHQTRDIYRLPGHMKFVSEHRLVGLNAGKYYFLPNKWISICVYWWTLS